MDKRFSAGRRELQRERARYRSLFLSAALFSAFVNLLMMTGPLFMLQVYDRVLGARAVETLGSLFALVVFLFSIMGILDFARGQLMARMAARFQSGLEERVFDAVMRRNALSQDDPVSRLGLADLESMQRMLGSRVLLALYDLPWSPLFFLAIFLFHPLLGLLALGGGALLILVTLLNRVVTRAPLRRASVEQGGASQLADYMREEAELIQALGMRVTSFQRWRNARAVAMRAEMHANDLSNAFTSLTRTLRQLMQSGMLALGAYVVLRGEMTPGAMIAGSILMGRALSPIETVISGWSMVARSWEGWNRLPELLATVPEQKRHPPTPRPAARLEARELTVIPPGATQAALRMVSFDLHPGEALGVIGSSGAGKTTLARTICGIWPPIAGTLKIDGIPVQRYPPDMLGNFIGYLPQRVTLFSGSIAENIARLSLKTDMEQVIDAAKRAAAHQMILDLPDGYETRVSMLGGRLSGGQVQRIGLARAIYGNPVLLILDEPNSNLDAEGANALNAAIRKMKSRDGAVLIMAHRPSGILECETLMMLERGQCRAFGPREDVLARTVHNAAQIAHLSQGGAPRRRGGS